MLLWAALAATISTAAPRPGAAPDAPPPPPGSGEVVRTRRLGRSQTVARALKAAGLEEPAISQVQGALKAAEFDFRKARPSDQLRLRFADGELEVLDYRRSQAVEWQVRRDGERYVGRRRELEREQRVEVVELTVESTVWDAALAAGEKPDVAVTLADVFAWDLDFYRDVQKGDRMRAVIEKVLHRGRLLEYGNVLAAEYVGASVGVKRTYRYRLPDGSESYFGPEGQSSRKTFLKSPLKFSFVTSGFGGRFQPILNTFGVHQGVDFQAAPGTPVWAVADGVVTRAGWDDGGGNTVCLQHVHGFESCYLHLSRIEVRPGERVAQKTVIAESGNTGRLTTGPHLHFGLRRGGVWVNPLNQNFPRADPLPRALLPGYLAAAAELQGRLERALRAAR